MRPLQTDETSRHLQLFENLRQQEQARSVKERVQIKQSTKAHEDKIAAFKAHALLSFEVAKPPSKRKTRFKGLPLNFRRQQV